MIPPVTDPPAEGVHTVAVEGAVLRYHVHGAGPVYVAHLGGLGIAWDYLRAPLPEKRLTMVYVGPVGTGGSRAVPMDSGIEGSSQAPWRPSPRAEKLQARSGIECPGGTGTPTSASMRPHSDARHSCSLSFNFLRGSNFSGRFLSVSAPLGGRNTAPA
jgi:hypothetical protein